jgi:hypothetical protein
MKDDAGWVKVKVVKFQGQFSVVISKSMPKGIRRVETKNDLVATQWLWRERERGYQPVEKQQYKNCMTCKYFNIYDKST